MNKETRDGSFGPFCFAKGQGEPSFCMAFGSDCPRLDGNPGWTPLKGPSPGSHPDAAHLKMLSKWHLTIPHDKQKRDKINTVPSQFRHNFCL